MIVEIIEFDKDYHTVTGRERKRFPTVADAETHCRERDGAGYSYSLGSVEPETERDEIELVEAEVGAKRRLLDEAIRRLGKLKGGGI